MKFICFALCAASPALADPHIVQQLSPLAFDATLTPAQLRSHLAANIDVTDWREQGPKDLPAPFVDPFFWTASGRGTDLQSDAPVMFSCQRIGPEIEAALIATPFRGVSAIDARLAPAAEPMPTGTVARLDCTIIVAGGSEGAVAETLYDAFKDRFADARFEFDGPSGFMVTGFATSVLRDGQPSSSTVTHLLSVTQGDAAIDLQFTAFLRGGTS